MPKMKKGKVWVSKANHTNSGRIKRKGATPLTKGHTVRAAGTNMSPSKRSGRNQRGKRVF